MAKGVLDDENRKGKTENLWAKIRTV